MMEEIQQFQENAQQVLDGGKIDDPVLLFTSDNSDLGLNPEAWVKSHQQFMDSLPNSHTEWLQLKVPHYMHNHDCLLISEKIIKFFE